MVENGTYKGQSVVCAGGNDSEVYFQVIMMNNEYLESAKEVEIFEYCIDTNQVVEKINLERKVLHLLILGE